MVGRLHYKGNCLTGLRLPSESSGGYRIWQSESNNLPGPSKRPILPPQTNRRDRRRLTELRVVTGFPPLETPRIDSYSGRQRERCQENVKMPGKLSDGRQSPWQSPSAFATSETFIAGTGELFRVHYHRLCKFSNASRVTDVRTSLILRSPLAR